MNKYGGITTSELLSGAKKLSAVLSKVSCDNHEKERTIAINVYCQGTKKNGQPCRRYLGKVEGKAELLCPVCKTWNVVEDGKIMVRERANQYGK